MVDDWWISRNSGSVFLGIDQDGPSCSKQEEKHEWIGAWAPVNIIIEGVKGADFKDVGFGPF